MSAETASTESKDLGNGSNPKLKAIMAIRGLVQGVGENWSQMNELGGEFDALLDKAASHLRAHASKVASAQWKKERQRVYESVGQLKRILSSVEAKLRDRDASNLSATWEDYHQHSESLGSGLKGLEESGLLALPDNQQADWRRLWIDAQARFVQINSYAEGCTLQLRMIEKFAPEEMDELTHIILKHVPTSYSLEDAER